MTTATQTVVDLATDTEQLAHLECQIAEDRPDEPTHALCGHPLIGVNAPAAAPRCPECVERMETAGGPFAGLLGLLRCTEHPR